MKDKILALLKTKEERKKELGKNSASTESVEELRGINAELEMLNKEIAELRSMVDEIDEETADPAETQEQRNQPSGQLNVIGTYGIGQQRSIDNLSTDQHDSPEYRSAFMEYVQSGVRSDALEFRADATTGVGDIGAVIPTTILNRIVEKMKDYGQIYARITQTSVQGGVSIPVSSAKPTASWVAAGTMSDKKKKEVKGTISFKYHKLQCRVAVELVAGIVAMPIFEDTLTDNIFEAMIVAIEEAIISGSGSGQPLGIINDTAIPASQVVEVSPEDFGKYQTWTTLFGKVPRKYRGGNVLIMADADWSKYISGMTDKNGQPIARVNYGLNGTIQEVLLGKDVLPQEDLLQSIDDAEEGDVVAIICKLDDYMLNSNMQLTFKRYFNEDTDESISKATLVGDGKLADRNGVVLIKKGKTTP